MTEGTGSLVGGIIGFLVILGIWIRLFLGFVAGGGSIFILFSPWTAVGIVVMQISGVAAFLGGSFLGSAAARLSIERE